MLKSGWGSREGRRGIALLIGLMSLGFTSLMCNYGPKEISARSFSALSDFTFVGSGPYQPVPTSAGTANEAVATHGTAVLALPERPQAGIQYVLLHRRPVDNEKLALVETWLLLHQKRPPRFGSNSERLRVIRV
jgi:hypothetical protein